MSDDEDKERFQEHFPTAIDPEERIANFRDVFQIFDEHKLGCIHISDLGDLMRACGLNITNAQIEEIKANVLESYPENLSEEDFVYIVDFYEREAHIPISEVRKMFESLFNDEVDAAELKRRLVRLCDQKLFSEWIIR